MFTFIKKLTNKIKWTSSKSMDSSVSKGHSTYMLTLFTGLLDDALFWKKSWLSVCVLLFLNIIVFVCAWWDIKLSEFVFKIFIVILVMDAFETWLRYKHRSSILKNLTVDSDTKQLDNLLSKVTLWFKKQCNQFIFLREANHTKAFLLANIMLGVLFIIGKWLNTYIFICMMIMLIGTFQLYAPPIQRLFKKIQQHAESDAEIESLIPDVSDIDMKILSIDTEQKVDDRQSLDYWKPDDLPVDDTSDSSDNSSSIITNLSMDRMKNVDKEIETSDSSDEEYIPLVKQTDHLQSTVEVVEPTNSWSSSALNALVNLTGAVTNMYTQIPTEESKRKSASSLDSSDGFEIIDKNDLM